MATFVRFPALIVYDFDEESIGIKRKSIVRPCFVTLDIELVACIKQRKRFLSGIHISKKDYTEVWMGNNYVSFLIDMPYEQVEDIIATGKALDMTHLRQPPATKNK